MYKSLPRVKTPGWGCTTSVYSTSAPLLTALLSSSPTSSAQMNPILSDAEQYIQFWKWSLLTIFRWWLRPHAVFHSVDSLCEVHIQPFCVSNIKQEMELMRYWRSDSVGWNANPARSQQCFTCNAETFEPLLHCFEIATRLSCKCYLINNIHIWFIVLFTSYFQFLQQEIIFDFDFFLDLLISHHAHTNISVSTHIGKVSRM